MKIDVRVVCDDPKIQEFYDSITSSDEFQTSLRTFIKEAVVESLVTGKPPVYRRNPWVQ